jgi:hypothetical protein
MSIRFDDGAEQPDAPNQSRKEDLLVRPNAELTSVEVVGREDSEHEQRQEDQHIEHAINRTDPVGSGRIEVPRMRIVVHRNSPDPNPSPEEKIFEPTKAEYGFVLE